MAAHPIRRARLIGAIIYFRLSLYVNYRKLRRNRATQSCLNCRTPKRKCDGYIPCSRCVQLGEIKHCVYDTTYW